MRPLTEGRLTAIAITNQSIHWFGVGLVVPVLAMFQIDRGLSLVQVGANAAIYSVTVALLELPTGGLSDSFGRRNVYLIAMAAHLLSAMTLAFAMTGWAISAGFVAMGLTRALSSGCMDAYFVDAFADAAPGRRPKGTLQRFLGRIGAAVPLALALGGLIGGYIPTIWPDGPTGGRPAGIVDRYSLLFFAVGAVAVIQVVVTLIIIPRRTEEHSLGGFVNGLKRFPVVISTAARHGIANRIVLFLLLGSAVWGIAFSGLEQYWQPFVKSIVSSDNPTRIFGFLTAGYFLVGTLGALVANALFRLIGPVYAAALIGFRILLGTAFVILSLTHTLPAFAAFYLLLFFLNGVSDSPEQTLLNENIPASARSTLMSFSSLFLQAGGGIAALVWGAIAEHRSIGLVWQIAGGIFAASALFYLMVALKLRKKGAS